MTQELLKKLKQKRRSQKRGYTVFILLWLAIIVLSAWISTYLPAQWDISREKRYSLTESSQNLLKKIDADISFTAFAGNDTDYRRAVRGIVEQYQKHHDNISLEFIDPCLLYTSPSPRDRG